MAKIKTFRFNASNDNLQQAYNVDLYYSSKEGWYAKLNSEFQEHAHNRFEELKPDGVERKYATKRDAMHGNESKRYYVIVGRNETDLENNIRKVYRILLSTVTKKRKVIIVFFAGEAKTQYGDYKTSKDFPQIQMTFGLTFCTEVKASETGVPKYYVYEEHDYFGEKKYRSMRYTCGIIHTLL